MGPDEQAIGTWLRAPAGSLSEPAIATARRHRVHLLIADALTRRAWRDRLGGDARPRTANLCGAAHAPRSGAQRDAGSPPRRERRGAPAEGRRAGLPRIRGPLSQASRRHRPADPPRGAGAGARRPDRGRMDEGRGVGRRARLDPAPLHQDPRRRPRRAHRSALACRQPSGVRPRPVVRRAGGAGHPGRAARRRRAHAVDPGRAVPRLRPSRRASRATTSISSGWSTSSGSPGC